MKKNGFTLIELLATIVILVAILAIAMPNILQVSMVDYIMAPKETMKKNIKN